MWTSPYVLSSFVVLREKRLSFEVRTVALDQGAHRDSEFGKQSLTSRVPVLIDGDFALSESSAIAEYLEDSYPAPAHPRVLPADARSRARARQVMAWVRSDLLPLREERSAEYVFYPHGELPPLVPLSPRGERAAQKLLAAAERLVPDDAGPMFGEWCVADTDLAMMLQRLVKSGHPVPKKVESYVDGQWQRPAVREFADRKRPLHRATVEF